MAYAVGFFFTFVNVDFLKFIYYKSSRTISVQLHWSINFSLDMWWMTMSKTIIGSDFSDYFDDYLGYRPNMIVIFLCRYFFSKALSLCFTSDQASFWIRTLSNHSVQRSHCRNQIIQTNASDCVTKLTCRLMCGYILLMTTKVAFSFTNHCMATHQTTCQNLSSQRQTVRQLCVCARRIFWMWCSQELRWSSATAVSRRPRLMRGTACRHMSSLLLLLMRSLIDWRLNSLKGLMLSLGGSYYPDI